MAKLIVVLSVGLVMASCSAERAQIKAEEIQKLACACQDEACSEEVYEKAVAWFNTYRDTEVLKSQRRWTWRAMQRALSCIVDTGFPADRLEAVFGYRPTPTPEEDDGPQEVSGPGATSAH